MRPGDSPPCPLATSAQSVGRKWSILPPRVLRGLLWTAVTAGPLSLLPGGDFLDQAPFLGLVAFSTDGGKRTAALLCAVLLFCAAFPPLCLPTYLVCYCPLVWLWGFEKQRNRWIWEALVAGFSASALATPFLRGSYPFPIFVVFSLSFALQMLGLAGALVATGGMRRTFFARACVAACVVTVLEFARSYWLGALLTLFSPAADSPLAQWAFVLTPFGVSGLLYLINFLWLPDWEGVGLRRWQPTALAAGILLAAWIGGETLRASLRPGRPPITALLVQPHHRLARIGGIEGTLPTRSRILSELTRLGLEQREPPDLIVWPENSLDPSPWEDELESGPAGDGVEPASLDLRHFYCCRVLAYKTPTLVGATIIDDHDMCNSACLITPRGKVMRYDKVKLFWILEWIPEWLDYGWLRDCLSSLFNASPRFRPGRDNAPITLKVRSGNDIRVNVAICYEMFFPSLPQFQRNNGSEVLITITDDSATGDYAYFYRLETWACQYHAIVTRNWHLVCANWSISALIDPRGEVRQILPNERGWLYVGGATSAETATRDRRSPVCMATTALKGLFPRGAETGPVGWHLDDRAVPRLRQPRHQRESAVLESRSGDCGRLRWTSG